MILTAFSEERAIYVTLQDRADPTNTGVANATPMEDHKQIYGQGAWYLNRIKLEKPDQRNRGQGSRMLHHLKAEIIHRGGRKLIVNPGGYDSDPDRLIRFYLSNNFRPVYCPKTKKMAYMMWEADENSLPRMAKHGPTAHQQIMP